MTTQPETGYSKADIHMHTNLGDGWASPAQIVQQATRHGLQVIAVTDHDHVEGAKRVADLLAQQKEPPFEMITGVEVSTRQGHLLGLFVQRAPKALRSVEESIEAIKEQGGLVVIPHPLGRLVPSLSRAKIDELLNKGFSIDGIEIYNPSPANASMRETALRQSAVAFRRDGRQRRALLAAYRRSLHALSRQQQRGSAPGYPRAYHTSGRTGDAASASSRRRVRRPVRLELVRRSATPRDARAQESIITCGLYVADSRSVHIGPKAIHCSGCWLISCSNRARMARCRSSSCSYCSCASGRKWP